MTKLRVGDWIEVRSKEDILRTLDKDGRLEGLPFMPQMFKHCGQRFQIYKSAHKTCDTVSCNGGRNVPSCYHLNLRCDGQAYGGCQAGCLMFWKSAWLKPVEGEGLSSGEAQSKPSAASAVCMEEDVWAATRVDGTAWDKETRYKCQATELLHFTTLLPWWQLSQYVEDYRSKNVSLGQLLRGFAYVCYYHGTQAWRDRVGRPARWLYDWIKSWYGGIPFPRRKGKLPIGQCPMSDLNLQPGELVRVKSYEEILATLDTKTNHRGLKWDAELVPYCGGTYRVKNRVERFVDEKTGRLTSLRTPAVILEKVWCQARYSDCRMFCPRQTYEWFREIWLERAVKEDLQGGQRRIAPE